jgi:hypothetical protein
MRVLFWVGLLVLILGIVSFVAPIPRHHREGVQIGGVSIGVETKHDEKVSPILGAVMVLSGAGLMIAGKRS